jgi:hypothetical protein
VLPMSALESRVFTLFSCLMIAKLMEHDNDEIEKVSFYNSMRSRNCLQSTPRYRLYPLCHTLNMSANEVGQTPWLIADGAR